MSNARTAEVERSTSETNIKVTLSLAGGDVSISTGVPFFDHMLEQVARHGHFGMVIHATGDLEIDAHHTVEDTGLALGEAFGKALGDKAGIRRYGDALVPMEEALAQVAVDISGRALLVYEAAIPAGSIGQFESVLVEEFLQALVRSAGLTLHVKLLAGKNAHHSVEAIFKALARALGAAVDIEPRSSGAIPSTKGTL